MEQKLDKKGFSHSPSAIKTGENGQHIIDEKASNHHIILASATQGVIYYTYKDNKYWSGENQEISEELFEKQFLPYLSWKFDKMEDEVVEQPKKDEKGEIVLDKKDNPVMIKIATGRKVNVFPPSPANIEKKRKEILLEASDKGESKSLQEIYLETAPKKLKNSERFEKQIEEGTPEDALARRINYLKY